ncbi:[Fe-Fe] hydrogenase large subunit C-terminal domain-containing protein [Acetobacteroides hydrogenigenes]|uniref:Iron only hydrogenase large subunit-like protein n=1 Tax=Acetobacteroides hydrogenigenes TaxID=979970 RepID=A0A4R2EHL8_9BACT|nr:[Fe-Fe] hydrogenase large subunit C-terminal domain-containing protein [Acetobacteroides hydrogenigenes]TCN67567.1 iron only hydrogenase large subunit-like protein [Acetobacteroides hydrogenigenes]
MENQLYTIDKHKCVTCYACIRACPVKAIEVGQNNENLQIIKERCIGCGLCEEACPVDAISYRKSIEECFALINSGGLVAALCEPSISAEFPDITDYRKFSQMLRAVGFTNVYEVSFGVDLVAKEYNSLLKEFRGKYFITSLCPSMVSLVEKYYPELVPNLAPIATPMVASAKVVKLIHSNKIKVVYIGPCVESKNEAKRYPGLVDAVITFRELREIFDDLNIKETTLEYSDFDAPFGAEGELYPIRTGFLEAANISQELLTGEITTVSESTNLISMLDSFERNIDNIKSHFNCFMCHGCLMGPGTTKGRNYQMRRSDVIKFARKRIQSLNRDEWHENLRKFKYISLKTSFSEDNQRIDYIPDNIAEDIYREINKDLKSPNLDCKACGFNSCKEMAIACYCGLSTPDICLLSNKKTIAKQRHMLKQEAEKYTKTREALIESEAQANQARIVAQEAQDSLYATIRKLPFGVVFVDKALKITYSNESFVELLGEDAMEINEVVPGLIGAQVKSLLPKDIYNQFHLVTHNPNESVNKDFKYKERLLNVQIFSMGKGNLVGGIFRDLMMPEIQKEEIIRRITEVIDKNLSIVQKIGFLLGEGAAESERMLNSIIKTFKQTPKEEDL